MREDIYRCKRCGRELEDERILQPHCAECQAWIELQKQIEIQDRGTNRIIDQLGKRRGFKVTRFLYSIIVEMGGPEAMAHEIVESYKRASKRPGAEKESLRFLQMILNLALAMYSKPKHPKVPNGKDQRWASTSQSTSG